MTIFFPAVQPHFGTAAAILSILAFLFYIRDIFRGRTVPQRTTWLVWSVLATVSVLAQSASGASHAGAFSIVQASATALIAVLSLAYGTMQRFTRLEILTLLGAGAGLAIWAVTETPAYALGISISLSALGAIPTLVKMRAAPSTEMLTSWGMLLVASVLAILAVGRADPIMLAYPIYLALLYSSILLVARYAKLKDARTRSFGPHRAAA